MDKNSLVVSDNENLTNTLNRKGLSKGYINPTDIYGGLLIDLKKDKCDDNISRNDFFDINELLGSLIRGKYTKTNGFVADKKGEWFPPKKHVDRLYMSKGDYNSSSIYMRRRDDLGFSVESEWYPIYKSHIVSELCQLNAVISTALDERIEYKMMIDDEFKRAKEEGEEPRMWAVKGRSQVASISDTIKKAKSSYYRRLEKRIYDDKHSVWELRGEKGEFDIDSISADDILFKK